jgi:hypothetical protein
MKDAHIKRQKGNPGAVLNTDRQGLQAYKRQKDRFQTINKLEEENKDLRERLERLEELVLRKGAFTT